MSQSTRQAIISALVFIVSAGVWFNAGVLRGLAHAMHLPIDGLLEILLYLGLTGMVVGLLLMVVFVPRWNAERHREAGG